MADRHHTIPMRRLAAGVAFFGLIAFGASPAEARHWDRRGDLRPPICRIDHDHRAHAPHYYDYYPADRFFRAGAYAGGPHWRAGRGFARRGRAVIYRNVLPTRGRARIVVVEEVVRRGRGPRRVCTVSVRGPDAPFVRPQRLRRVVRRHCSPRARVRIGG